ncbi:MAG: hypothetical protein JO048_04005, partial [Methylobacteriaceae bacterium]|nr:hypothetical protein [Methylobacteriaceae bacterium]
MGCRAALLALWAFAAPAAIALGPPSSALAQSQLAQSQLGPSQDVTLTDVSLKLGPATYRAKTLTLRGTRMSQAEAGALFDPRAPQALAARFAALNAAEITIPELVSESAAGTVRQTATYRNVRLSDIQGGSVARTAVAGGSAETVGPDGTSRAVFGASTAEDTDLAAVAALFVPPAAGAPPEAKRLYASISLEGLSGGDPKTGGTFRVGRLAARDIKGRPTKDGLTATFAALAAKPSSDNPSAAERNRVFAILADLFDSVEIGSFEATDLTGGSATQPELRIARLGFSGGERAEFRVEGLQGGAPGASFRVGAFSLGGFSPKQFVAAIRGLSTLQSDELDPADARKLVPGTGAIRVSDVAVEVPADKGRPAGRVSIGSVELSADKPVEGLPSEIRVALRDLSVPMPKSAEDDGLKQLVALGYERIEGSLAAELAWSEPSREIALREL